MNPQIEIFNSHLRTYQKVLENNYMFHEQFYQVVHEFLQQHFSQSFSLLDLGCGDASFISQTLKSTKIKSYTGVDLSELSLANATKNVQILNGQTNFFAADLGQFISDLLEQKQQFDCIFSAFALHHLTEEEKANLFPKIAKILRKNGVFILIDVFRKIAENREQYLARYFNAVAHWRELTSEEINLVKNHIMSSDFPETETTIRKMAQGNFTEIQCLYQDPIETGRLLIFS